MQPRIRTVKPEFFKHYGLYIAEKETKLPIRLAFEGLWVCADREGRFKWRPEELKLHCLPYDNLDFSRVLDALVTRGFVVKYASNGEEFGAILSFSRHQVINNRERESELPDPLLCGIDPTTLTRAPRVGDACPTPLNLDQAEGKGREGKGRERKATRQRRCPQDFILSDGVREWGQKNFPLVDLDAELEKMKDKEFKQAYSDWDAVFRTWIRNAVKWEQ
jgi:hypothetical protein